MNANSAQRKRIRLKPHAVRVAAERRDLKTDLALAVKLGMAPSTLSNVLGDIVRPDNETVAAVLDLFGADFNGLCEITTQPLRQRTSRQRELAA